MTIQISEREKVVSAKQHLRGFLLVGYRFDYIQLIKKAAARWNLAEVLGFIDHDCDRPAIVDSLLDGVLVLCADRP